MIMDSIFSRGFQSQFPNMQNWAQMPAAQPAQPSQGLPTPQPTIPAPGAGIQSVADYNTMTPLAGGTPAGATPATSTLPTGVQARIDKGGLIGAILRQFANKGLFNK